MRKLFLILGLVLVGAFFGQKIGSRYLITSNASLVDPKLVSNKETQVVQKPQYYSPQTLIIPKIDVAAQVESVGEDSKGNMDVPKKAEDVGWYSFGYKTGEKGSVVLAGHLDDVYGRPAVFWNLSKLERGDEILVTDEAGKEFKYIVTGKEIYPYDQFPLREVFMSNDKPRLNLITCQGKFDKSSKKYSHRIVVYSELSD